ncbi:alanine--tRNA ligase [Acetanaerobacterium elongatum]|uniref:Alanine--tRNA ligase n=1 Tax=Acetanaerobacterium elongatum TaxID=258515 RepID=A0A1H0C0C7_9FIRM|nr:alanine--tRNA ligase [Acetanaerobacterium elongatum]SDN51266.1 alanyl-tRNA synthetase [Acetanaerobacterium elongatum]
MQWQGLNDLREAYLSFFESKAHTRLKSFSLVPNNDKSLLLINSGMAPMKKYFLGQETPPSKRVTTCQKCIRTPDIERVGKTARHGTYFEMLGNFSFGDYFKVEAINWAWEFFTKKLEIPAEKLYISVFEEDDEAYDIWTKQIGVAPEHMVHLGREDNFWEHGSGPCGPCSEIYFDRGPEKGCGKPGCAVGCDCDRYVEVWNLVFSQFDSDGKGHYTRIDHPNIDTGMGLERLACVMQGVDNLFEVDTVQNIMKHVSQIAGIHYGNDKKTDISLRVITDHIRSTVFMVGDGVIPSNEGRGYVLRRLLRRAARHGRLIGIHEPFLYKVCDTVINENKSAYPELAEKAEYIKKHIRVEEERFARTIDQGMELLASLIDEAVKSGSGVFSGDEAFKLYDTFGFPIDLTREIVEEKKLKVDDARFEQLMTEQKTRAREDRKKSGGIAWASEALGDLGVAKTVFTGYGELATDAKILAIVKDNEATGSAAEGDTVILALDKTPFYAESGGQVADTGIIRKDGAVLEVTDCKKNAAGQYLHSANVLSGTIETGDTVTAEVDKQRRASIMRNHTSAHLLQAALRAVLGDHVHQAGSLVTPEHVRFDFSHFSAMTAEEIKKTEDLVNEKILEALPVTTEELPIEEAKKRGAMALFGEKYGDTVRVVEAKGFSTEFCGGTHADNTAKLGLFKIISESSVAAGVRRIEGTTGLGVLKLFGEMNATIAACAQNLKAAVPAEVVSRAATVMAELREKEKEIEALGARLAGSQVDDLCKNSCDVCGIHLIAAPLTDAKVDTLRLLCDKIKEKDADAVAVLSNLVDGKGSLMIACGSNAVAKGLNAGKLIKELAAIAGGSGGGRPDSAMAGVKEPQKLSEALEAAPGIIHKALGQ